MKKTLLLSITLFILLQVIAQEVPDSLKIVQDGWSYYQNDYRIRDRDILEITEENPIAFKYMERAQTFNVLSYVSGIAGVAGVGYPVVRWIFEKPANWKLSYFGVTLVTASITCSVVYYFSKNKAIRIYNKGTTPKPTARFKPDVRLGFNGNGIGLAMRF